MKVFTVDMRVQIFDIDGCPLDQFQKQVTIMLEVFLGTILLGWGSVILFPWWCIGIFVIMSLADSIMVEYEKAGWGFVMMLSGALLMIWVGAGISPWDAAVSVIDNLTIAFQFVLVYLFVGGIWSVIKWFVYAWKLDKETMKYHKKHGEPGTKPSRPYESYPSNNGDRIIGWIAHWPFSIIGTFFADILFRAFKLIRSMFGNVYNAIANSMFNNAKYDQ